jgi:hypothetical protein
MQAGRHIGGCVSAALRARARLLDCHFEQRSWQPGIDLLHEMSTQALSISLEIAAPTIGGMERGTFTFLRVPAGTRRGHSYNFTYSQRAKSPKRWQLRGKH